MHLNSAQLVHLHCMSEISIQTLNLSVVILGGVFPVAVDQTWVPEGKSKRGRTRDMEKDSREGAKGDCFLFLG